MPLIFTINVVASTLAIAGLAGFALWRIATQNRQGARTETTLGPYQVQTAHGVLQLIPVRP